MSHTPKNQFAKPFFDKTFVPCTKNFFWLLGAYGALHDNVLVQSFRENPATFSRVAEHNGTALSMSFFNARRVLVRERGYAISHSFADPTTTEFFKILNCL